MNDKDYELIGESIWDTYRNMASILTEKLGWKGKAGAAVLAGTALVAGMKRETPQKSTTVMQKAAQTERNVDDINQNLRGIRKAVRPYTRASAKAIEKGQEEQGK